MGGIIGLSAGNARVRTRGPLFMAMIGRDLTNENDFAEWFSTFGWNMPNMQYQGGVDVIAASNRIQRVGSTTFSGITRNVVTRDFDTGLGVGDFVMRLNDSPFSLRGDGYGDNAPAAALPRPVRGTNPLQTLTFTEVLRVPENTIAGANGRRHYHGFGTGEDNYWTVNPVDIQGGNQAFIGLCFDGLKASADPTRVQLIKSNFLAPTVIPLPVIAQLFADRLQWVLVEHRWDAPSAGSPARYQLSLNEVLVHQEFAGAANFPQPDFGLSFIAPTVVTELIGTGNPYSKLEAFGSQIIAGRLDE
jgi:hypothetical protein